jgi:glycogen(starch) synthase
MRVAMVSWEYPPLVVGGLAAHVHGLATAMARAGHDVVVLTRAHPYAPDDAELEGVRVLRAHVDLPWVPSDNPLAQVISGNHQLAQLGASVLPWQADVVHAHDWLGAWAGDTLREAYKTPFVATVHATELGRHQGHLTSSTSEAINAAEWWLTYQAQRVICCSGFMVEEVVRSFQLPRDKIVMVPNGVDPSRFAAPGVPRAGSDAPLLVSWGRLEYEKGFQTLIGAVARLLGRRPNLRCAIVGRGTYSEDLRGVARGLGVGDAVQFAGFVSDDELVRLLNEATCAVIPSLYEPFGIVALEAVSAGAPLIAAESGGLREVLTGTDAGLLFPPGNADALAAAVDRMLTEPGLAEKCQAAGAELVRTRYSWDAIAASTIEVYEQAGARPKKKAKKLKGLM